MQKRLQAADNREVFESMPVWKALRAMCIPTIIGQMVVLIYNLADTFFIGQTGNPYMVAATSLILPVFNLSNALSNFVGIGCGSLISRLLGMHRDEEARKVSAFSFWFGLIVSAAYSLAVFLFSGVLLTALGASKNTFAYAKQYLTMVTVLKDNYDAGKRYYDYERSRLTEDGFLNHGLGDWGNPDGELSRENIETAFLYADAETLMKFASALGRTGSLANGSASFPEFGMV